MHTTTQNIVSLKASTGLFPVHIDRQLQQEIKSYIGRSGNTYATLARDIDRFVREQYENMWNLVEDGKITQHQLEKHIKDHTPSRSYLNDYAKGRPICFRYTNTIANFFQTEYTISNFDPSRDLAAFIALG